MTEATFSQHVTDVVRRLFHRQTLAVVSETRHDTSSQHVSALHGSVPTNIPEAISASKLQLIGLTRVRSAVGERWPQLAKRVRSVAETVINKYLLPGDIFEPHGEDGFLVLFVQLAPEDARFKAEAISHEVEARLIGSGLSDVATCSAEMTAVDLGAAVSKTQQGATEYLQWNEHPSQESSRQGDASRRSAEFDSSVVKKNSNTELSGASSEHASSPLSSPLKTAPPEDAMSSLGAAVARSEKTVTFGTESNQVVGYTPAQELKPRSRFIRSSDIGWFYRPVWDYRHSALILFALQPQLLDNSALEQDTTANAEFLSDLDTAAVVKAAADLAELSKSSRRLPLLVQAHYDTVADRRRSAFLLATIKQLPQQHHKLLFLEIVGRPCDEPTSDIADFIAALRAIHVRTAMRVDPLRLTSLAIKSCGAGLATMTLPPALPEAAQMKALEGLAERAAVAKLDCAVWNIATRSIVIAAAAAGIRYLSGSAVAEDLLSLSNALRYSLADLYPR